MARKRMLSPDIWESESFSLLSDQAKIVFIGLISLADDDGRGKANPAFIKSTLFPYDEKRRVADVKSALSEIARCMSTQFYSVDGNDYYFMKNWKKWQKIDKPSKSKLPAPPDSGVGALYTESEDFQKFDEHSTKIRRTLDEQSALNRIEENKNKNLNTTNVVAQVGLSDEQYSKLCAEIGKADCDYYISRVKAFLSRNPNARKLDVYSCILKWRREDLKKDEPVSKTYKAEDLNAMFADLTPEDL